MSNDECRMNNKGILSFLLVLEKMKRSDFHHSSFVIRHSTFQRIVNPKN
jgi:hypothetical protein